MSDGDHAEPRLGAKKTKPFELATAGLAVVGQHWFFQQRFECTSDSLHVTLFGLRGLEGNPIVQVLKRHPGDVIRLLEQFEILSSALEPSDEAEELGLAEFVGKLRLVPEREWEGTWINGRSIALPIEDLVTARPVLHDFITLFPIFRAATDVLRGEDDRFQQYAEQFWSWRDRLQTDEGDEAGHSSIHKLASPVLRNAVLEGPESVWEGGFKIAIRRHRLREKRLRKRKIQETLRVENGRLRCEVPGCGFDFLAVYGELGRDYAHVHHKKPLSDRTNPEMTKLSELAIVCANCHSMIHRGGLCRALEDLKPQCAGWP